MRKPKYITAENYQQFKPSEFVRSFVSDIEVAEKMGKPMDMRTYIPRTAEPGCLPCLGGMACMNMGFTSTLLNDVSYNVAGLGDAIRTGTASSFRIHINNLYPKCQFKASYVGHTKTFEGVVRKGRLSYLKAQVHKYADALEAQGY